MANGWLAGLGGFTRGLAGGLEQGLEWRQRQEAIEQQREQHKLNQLVQGLKLLEGAADVPDEYLGPYFKSLGQLFEKTTGSPLDPNIQATILTARRKQADVYRTVLAGVRGDTEAGEIDPNALIAILSGKRGPEGLSAVLKMGELYATRGEQRQLADIFKAPLPSQEQPPTAFPVAPMPGGGPPQGMPPQGGATSPATGALDKLNQDIGEMERRLNRARLLVKDPNKLKNWEGALDDAYKRRQQLEKMAGETRPFAPTPTIVDLVEGAGMLGKQYRPHADPLTPEIAQAGRMAGMRRSIMQSPPKSPAALRAWTEWVRTVTPQTPLGDPTKLEQTYMKWAEEEAIRRGAGARIGQWGVEEGTYQPLGPLGAPAPSPAGPSLPFAGTPGETPIAKRAGEQVKGRLQEEPFPESVQTALNSYNNILASVTQFETFSAAEIKRFTGLLQSPYQRGKLAVKGTLGLSGPEEQRFADFKALMGRLKGTAFGEGGKQLTPFEAGVVFQYTPIGNEAGGATEVLAKVKYLRAFTKIARDTRIQMARTGRAAFDSDEFDAILQRNLDKAGLRPPGIGGQSTAEGRTIQTPLGGATVRPRR